jgi:hypothetical protein
VSNFDVNGIDITPGFYETGWWYDYFNNDSINVSDEAMNIRLEAGEFKVFTNKRLQTPDFVDISEVNTPENSPINFYPNPGNGNFTLSLHLAAPSKVEVAIYNLSGQLINSISKQNLSAGSQEIAISLDNNLPGGIYISKVLIEDKQFVNKLIKK